ncbi:MAG: ATP phosphoribosyltransferase regulatory subunit [Burkholderiales bacterium]
MRNWLLPEYLEDILPPEAQRIEHTRRALLDLFHGHGYELVMPPLLEYVESLLTGTGRDMDLATFKLVDQLSGRQIGIRADITPQVARIDAHLLNRKGVTRLCYAGNVLHTLPSGIAQSREPLKIGAELYGHAGIESDIEIQRLMLEALRMSGVKGVTLDLGHVGIFRALAKQASISAEHEGEMFRVLLAKDVPSLRELTQPLPAISRDALRALPELYGGIDMLDAAQKRLPALPEISSALNDLQSLAQKLTGDVEHISFDLAELRGYHYHSGVVFAAYAPGYADAIARGGRYDQVGKAFGRSRPATGFDMDLRELARQYPTKNNARGILAPFSDEVNLSNIINKLRNSGEIVKIVLPGSNDHRAELDCDREIAQVNGAWQVRNIS